MKNYCARFCLALAILISPPSLLAANATWVAGMGSWLENALFWSSGFPAAGDDIFISNPNLEQRLVVTGISPQINSLTVNANNMGIDPDEFHISNGHSVTVGSTGIVNQGIVSLNAGGSATSLILQGGSTINGVGTILMSNSENNILRNSVANEVFTLGASGKIQGAGKLLNNIGGMINLGTIIADQANRIVIDADAGGFTQGGTLRATGVGGLLILNTPTFTNTNGIDIEAGSKLEVIASKIIGGEINIAPTASANFKSSTDLDSLTINGDVTHDNGQSVDIINGLSLNGQWNMNATGSATSLLFHGSETLTGDGTLNLSDSVNNIVRSNTAGDILTIDTDVTIKGAGKLIDNVGGMINLGTIIADQANRMTIDANTEGFTQGGTLRATGTGGLLIQNTPTFTNTNGIDIEAGSKLEVIASKIVGGEINIAPTASANFKSSTDLNGLTINGEVTHDNGQSVDIINGLSLNGQWNMNATGSATSLLFHGSETLTGDATLNLSNSVNNIVRSNTAGDILTIDTDVTIQGAGKLIDNIGGMINLGTIIADKDSQLIIDANTEGFTQGGALRATGTGGLLIQNTPTFTNTNGIDIEAGSKLEVIASKIIGGEINIAPTASANFKSSTDLDGLTINGDVTHDNGQSVDIINGLSLNGQWNMNATGSATSLLFHSSETLTGDATLNLSDSVNNIVRSNTAGDILTIDTDVTIKGAGKLIDNVGGMINLGTIIADQANRMTIDANTEGFTQGGTLRATGTGGLLIQNTPTFTNTNGIDIEAGSKLEVIASKIIGGEINIAPTASANFKSSTDLDSLTINGDVTHDNGQSVDIINGLSLNGQWNMNATGSATSLLFHGSETLTGDATLNLSNSVNNIVRSNTAGDKLTIDTDVTIKGAGKLIDNVGGMINLGTIIADQANRITIDANTEGFTQGGTLRATGTGGLLIQNTPTFTNTNGIDIEAGSKLEVIASKIIGGEINIAPTASANFKSSTDLDGLTINGEVTHDNGQSVDIINGLSLNGQWNMNATGSATSLLFHSSETLTGDGTLNLSNSVNNIVRSNTAGDILTIDTDITIRGAGILANNTGGLINKGTILADKDSQLIIDPNALGFENRGQLTATGTQGLRSVGSYRQTSGTTTVNSILQFTSNGELDLEGGVLNGTGMILGDVNNTGGTVNPGNSPGELTIDENYTQGSGGLLLIEIAGTGSGEFDTLQVNGNAALAGTIAVSLLGSPGISIGDTFDVLFASEIFGTFDNSVVSAGNASFAVSIINQLNQDIVRLTATSAVPVPAAVWMLLSGMLVLLSRKGILPKVR